MRKILSLLLALCLLCGAASAAELQLKYLNPALYPVCAEGAELTVWARQLASVEDFDTNLETLALEELTGVHINWILANHSEIDSKFNLSIASGDYPDVYLANFSRADVLTYAGDGVIIPLNELLESTYWLKQYMEADPLIGDCITAPDGSIYTLWLASVRSPEDEKTYNSTMFKLWVFKPWLEKSGMDMPATLDEYVELLRYFRDNDMNGNGDPSDEIPLLGTYQYDDQGSDPMYAIMNCFQLIPSNFLMAEDGKVSCVAVTDGFREGLRFLRAMHDEGLFPEEIYSLDLNQYRAVVNVTKADDMVVGSAAAPMWMRFVTQSIYADAYDDFTFIPPLARDADTPARTVLGETAVGCYGAITCACADPALAMAWLDAIADPEIHMTTVYGEEGKQWIRLSEEGQLPIVYEAGPESLTGSGSTQNIVWQNWTQTQPPLNGFVEASLPEGTTAWKHDTILWAANAAYIAAGVRTGFPPVAWCTDTDLTTERSELRGPIEDAIATGFSEFILGRKDINDDAQWEAYKANLYALGLERYLELNETYYFGS